MKKHLLLLCGLLAASNLYAQQGVGYQDNWWKPNVDVYAIARSGNTVYVGGNFRYVGPTIPMGAALEPTTGVPDPRYVRPNGAVNACVPDGAGGWYIGGYFTYVGGQPRNHLARINSDGTLHPWNPNANEAVFALATRGSTVYVAGQFDIVGGQARNQIAAMDTATGIVRPWNPNAGGYNVNTLAVSGSTVYAGGRFNTIGGQPRSCIAALDSATGMATAWSPNATPASSTVHVILVNGSTVYVGGDFNGVGGQARSRIAAIDTTTGNATSWNPGADDRVDALAVSGSTVYAGGYFNSIGGQGRNGVAAIDATMGTATSWNPGVGGFVNALAVSGNTVYVGGRFNSNIASIDAITGSVNTWPSASGDINALAVNGNALYAGGQFTSIGGQPRNGIAALNATTGMLTPWNPDAGGGNIREIAVSGSTVYALGAFNSIGGQARAGLAALDSATGMASSWYPILTGGAGYITAIAVNGNTVYIGGDFTAVDGMSRNKIAAVDATTSFPTSWNPNITGVASIVNVIMVSGNTVYAAGRFGNVSGQPRKNIVAIDATTGTPTSWDPSIAGNINRGVYVYGMMRSGNTVYAAGQFDTVGGQARNNIVAIDATTGIPTSWNPNANGTVSALAMSGSTVYAGGQFDTVAGQRRAYIAAIDTATGALMSWNPNADRNVSALAVDGSTVYAGGQFLNMGGGNDATRPFFMVMEDSTSALFRPLGVASAAVLEKGFSFSAFPNPADGKVMVRSNGAVSQTATVQVMSLLGAAVKEVTMQNGQTEIDLSGVATGVYLLRYKDAEGRTGIIRLMKQ